MSNTYFMGIDIGTYESKGVLIDKNCKIVAIHTTAHGLENPQPNHFEHDAEQVWWKDFCSISKTLIEKAGIHNSEVAGVGTSALGCDCLPVDEFCRPLRKAILYGIDSRAHKEIEFMTEYYGEKKVEEIWGGPLRSSNITPKILWIKNNEPEVYAKTYKFLTASSYITAKLTGEYVIDRFLIDDFFPIYNPDGSLNPEMGAMYCRPDQMAECRLTTDVVGYVTEKAASETGLAEGTPCLTGTDDSGAESISTGVFKPGDMMIQLGSTCYLIYCSDKQIQENRLWGSKFIIPNTFSITGGTNAAGTLTRWFRDTLFFDALEKEKKDGCNAYETMLEGLDAIPAGSDGLIALPYFAGERTPINDPFAKGAFFGMKLTHTRQHMYKAMLEGVAYSLAQHLDIIKENKLEVKKLMAVGGGTKNKPWLQIIADITGMTVHTASVTIGASYGDALMAALGTGYYKSFSEFENVIEPGLEIKPIKENVEKYKHYRRIFDKLYNNTKDLMHEL